MSVIHQWVRLINKDEVHTADGPTDKLGKFYFSHIIPTGKYEVQTYNFNKEEWETISNDYQV